MELEAFVMILNILQNEKNVIALRKVKGSRCNERLRMFPHRNGVPMFSGSQVVSSDCDHLSFALVFNVERRLHPLLHLLSSTVPFQE